MRQMEISASKCYSVTIGGGLLAQLGWAVQAATKAKKVCIVSDSHVWPLYGSAAESSCREAGLDVCHFVFPAGETSKNGATYLELLNFLAENAITRSDCIAVLGGGVAGDLAGFAAATYLRGIPYIQLPTSLLAMVDSAVGGKTGIDLPGGKNLCGAFYQPTAVLCDISTLSTLPDSFFRDGCAEVIKYAVLFDPELFAILERDGLAFDREFVIARCIRWKAETVEQDELDRGCRKLLNLGHTIGHAMEGCSHYEISHGRAVAIGMVMTARAAKCRDTERIVALLQAFGLPVSANFSAEQLYQAALSDKKRSGDSIDLIVPMTIGSCAVRPTALADLKTFIKEGM